MALVPTLPSVQAEPPTKPRPSAIRRTPLEPIRHSTRPSASATTTIWPASVTEERAAASRGTNSPSRLSERRRSSSPPLSGGTSGVEPGSSPTAATRRQEAAMVPRGGRWPGSGHRGRAAPRSRVTVQLLVAVGCNVLQPCRRLVAMVCARSHQRSEGETMTQTREPQSAPAESRHPEQDEPAQERVDAWLARLRVGAARARRRGARRRCSRPRATGATWSRSPGTSRPSRAATAWPSCSASTLESTDPSGFATEEPPDEADGVVTAWIVFETGVGRGRGLLRLMEEDGEDRAWTLLTTLYELKGHEEPRGTHRPMGAEHGANKQRQTWLEQQQEEAETPRQHHPALRAGRRRRPGRHRPRRPAAAARRPEPGHRQARPARRPVAQPLQVAVPARPGLVRPPALPEVPGQLAGVLAQGQDRRLAGVLHQDHGGALLVEHDGHQRVVHRGDGGVDRRGRARGQRRSRCAHAAGASPPGCPASPTSPTCPARTSSAATSTTPRRTPARTPTPARRASSSAATTPPSTSAAPCGRTTPT